MSRRRKYSYWGYSDFYRQPTVGEIESSAHQALQQAAKKGLNYHPVVATGRNIANSWWGQSWCHNLERYADYANRLPRGRTYIRHGSVLDLNISEGRVDAIVQGSSQYKIRVTIDPMEEKKEKELAKACANQIENVDELLSGKFPVALKDKFLERGSLFPTMKEIHFNCSCPDSASMCKHIAAVMYGIAVRLDDDPMHFFTLRSVNIDDFVTKAIENKVDSMLKNASKKSDRIMDDKEIEGLFGVL